MDGITNRSIRWILAAALIGAALSGCGSEEPLPYAADAAPPITDYDGGLQQPVDSGTYVPPVVDSGTLPPPVDSGTVTPPTATCPPVAPGALPALSGVYYHTSGAGAQTPPNGAGGDPTGTWAASRVTVYLPAAAAGLVTAESSTLSGTGWFQFDGAGGYKLGLDVNVMLATIIGPQGMALSQGSIGTYTVSGASIPVVPACSTGGEGLIMGTPQIQFTATTGAATAQFIVITMTSFGEIRLLVEANRI